MDIKLIMKSARSAVLELADGGIYRTEENYDILVNGVVVKKAETVITSLYDLKPETEYEVTVKKEDGSVVGSLHFQTDYEFVTLNVKISVPRETAYRMIPSIFRRRFSPVQRKVVYWFLRELIRLPACF